MKTELKECAILVINDMQDHLDLLRSLLIKAGYKVETAQDGKEGFERAIETDPSLIISDVVMPKINGIELCRLLRSHPAFQTTPILLISAMQKDNGSVLDGFQAGADDYLEFPFTPMRLIAKVTRLIERKELEQTLKNSEAKFKDLFDNAPVGYHELDRKGRYVSVNQTELSMLGYEADDLIGHYAWEFMSDRAGLKSALSRLVGEDSTKDAERILRCKDGSLLHVLVEDRVLFDHNNEIVGIRSTLQDISQRKRIEAAMLASEQKYRFLVEHIPEVVWSVDHKGRWAFISQNITTLSGYAVEEFGEFVSLNVYPNVHPDDSARVKQAHKDLFKENVAYDIEYRFKHKDGNWIWLHEKSLGTYQKEGVLYADGTLSDVTERKRFEQQLQQAQKLESIGQLAAGIAHEINTPTQYVGDNARFIKDSFADIQTMLQSYEALVAECKKSGINPQMLDDITAQSEKLDIEYLKGEIPKALDQTLEGIERIIKIVQSMKDFAHPGSSEKKTADLNKAIESAITVSRNEWKYVADMDTDFDAQLPTVPCFAGELNQVWLNMIVNAAHAIGDANKLLGRERGKITVSTRRTDNEYVEVCIADNGTGIPEKHRAQIFDPFFTTKEVGKGTGQGLAISHRVIVDKHKGALNFETEEGTGTKFIIRLPLNENSKAFIC
jgi:PAS domain S-box-containing protein